MTTLLNVSIPTSESRLLFQEDNNTKFTINEVPNQNWNVLSKAYEYIFFWQYLNLSMSNCLPQSSRVPGSPTKSPYQNFNGSFSFVVTVVGAPQTGKTTLCNTLRGACRDVSNQKYFRFSTMPPEFQIELPKTSNNTNTPVLGIYDTIGFQNIDLLKYILEGQNVDEKAYLESDYESESGFDTSLDSIPEFSMKLINKDPKKKKRSKKINSEGFVVVFDITRYSTFEMACAIIDEIYEYFSFDPLESTGKAPVTIYLIGTKKDLVDQRQVGESQVKLYLEQLRGFVNYFEMSEKDTSGIQSMFGKMASQIEEQRNTFQASLKGQSFWD
mmetsp:Transcript_26295/g.37035  ORF Transcript_26295/g.37035 Transcript_26295/m.37035 type:complete len:328 (+) Transcript_26295:115-1098(+)